MDAGIRAHSRLTTLHLADGGFVENLKQRFGFGGPPETMTEKFAKRDAELRAKQAARAATPAPAPDAAPGSAAARLGGINLDAMKRREEAAGLKHGGTVPKQGGVIRGPGTGRSDSIPAKMKPGSFVLPADSTKRLSNVRVSNGEGAFPPEVVRRIGAAALLAMRDVTHQPRAGRGGAQRLAGGGEVDEQRPNSFGDAAAAANNAGVTQVGASPSVQAQMPESMSAPAPAPVSAPSSPMSGGGGGNSFGDAAAFSQDSSVRQVGVSPSGSSFGTQLSNVGGAIVDGLGEAAKAVTSYPTSSDGKGYGLSRGIDETTPFGSSSAPSTGATSGGALQQPYSDARSGTGGYDAAARLSTLPGGGGQDSGGQTYDLSKGKDVGFGTTRFDGGSSPLFTNVPNAADNASLMGRGTVSARNDNAAQVLSDRTQQESTDRVKGQMAAEQFQKDADYAQSANAAMNARFNPLGRQSLANQQAVDKRSGDAADRVLARQDMLQRQSQLDTKNKLAQNEFGLKSNAASLDARSKMNTLNVQDAYLKAKSPQERALVQSSLQALSGHPPAPKFTVARGGRDADGNVQPDQVINNNTGEFMQPPRQQRTPPSQAIEMLKRDKSLVQKFDEYYGPGTSSRYLGGR